MKSINELIESKIQIGNIYTAKELRAMVAEPIDDVTKSILFERHKDVMRRYERDERQAYMRTLLNIESLLKALFDYKPMIRVSL